MYTHTAHYIGRILGVMEEKSKKLAYIYVDGGLMLK